MFHSPFPDDHIHFLRDAAHYLEEPSYLMRIANTLGRPLESVAKGLVPEKVAQVSQLAMDKAMQLVTSTISQDCVHDQLRFDDADKAAGWHGFWHKLGAATMGFPGGLFGLPGLAIELPVTTAIMLRSIASIAGDFGHDVRNPSTG